MPLLTAPDWTGNPFSLSFSGKEKDWKEKREERKRSVMNCLPLFGCWLLVVVCVELNL